MADPRINVFNPDGDMVSLPAGQINDALQAGYTSATPEQVNAYHREQEFGTTGQQLITAAEGLASGATLHMSEPIEVALGLTTPERIQARKEENPLISAGSEVAGLAGSALVMPEVGAAKMLTAAGDLGAARLGFTGATTLGKIGSAAVKAAIENGVYQGTDETAKLFMGAPNSVQTAAANVGLAGILGGGIGGAIGSVSPLWKATMGDKLSGWLGAVQRRMNGEMAPLPSEVRNALQTVGEGLEVPGELKGAVAHPEIADDFNSLMESQTAPGIKLKDKIQKFKSDATNFISEALGKTPEDLMARSELSHFEAGSKAQDALADQIKKTFDPINEAYDRITAEFSELPLTSESDEVADKLARLAEEQGWGQLKDSPQNKFFNSVMDGLPSVETLEGLRKFQSNIWGMAKSDPSALYGPARQISNILDDVLNSTYLKNAGIRGPEFLDKYNLTKSAYKAGKDLIEELNSRLHVGRYGGPGTFINALKEMRPEQLISRLSNVNDVGLQQLLNKEFPQIASLVKEYQLNRLVAPSVSKAAEGHALNAKMFFTALDKLTPEMRSFILPEGAEAKLQAMRTLLDAIPKYKSSGTAGNLDKLWSQVPGSASAGVSMLLGHNPIMGWLVGHAAKLASRDIPDAAKLAMLKFMGSDAPIEAEGFKAMLDFAHTVTKSETTLNNVTKAVFKAEKDVLPSKYVASADDLDKLDKRLKDLEKDPSQMQNVGGKVVHYMPDHGMQMAEIAQNAVNYLNSIRPRPQKALPLDKEMKVDPIAEAKFRSALMIAQSPMSALQSAKDGTLTANDVVTFRTLYPVLYQRTVEKLNNQMADHLAKDGAIPYKTRLGLSLFMTQPLDSTMTPQGILSAQPKPQAPPPPPQQQTMGKTTQSGMQKLSKMPQLSMTSDQASLARNLTQN